MYKYIITLLFVTNFAFSQNADDIIGKYHLPNNLDVEFFKENGTYSGKIIALNGYEDGRTKDSKNSDSSLKNRDLLGLIIIKNLKFDPEKKEWVDGEMYGPDKGIHVNLEVTELKDDKITVIGSKFLFWKTLTWKKI
jgi:hypothetical protein